MNCSPSGLPVHHQLPEPAQTHVHWVGDAIQPSHPLSSPSPPAFNLSKHQGLFHWIDCSYQVAKVLELQLQHQSFQWIHTHTHTHTQVYTCIHSSGFLFGNLNELFGQPNSYANRTLFAIYLKYKFNWVSWIFSGTPSSGHLCVAFLPSSWMSSTQSRRWRDDIWTSREKVNVLGRVTRQALIRMHIHIKCWCD